MHATISSISVAVLPQCRVIVALHTAGLFRSIESREDSQFQLFRPGNGSSRHKLIISVISIIWDLYMVIYEHPSVVLGVGSLCVVTRVVSYAEVHMLTMQTADNHTCKILVSRDVLA